MNKIIKWSSFRYNEYKKSEVIDLILKAIEKGKDTEKRFSTGSYSKTGHLGGCGYILYVMKNINRRTGMTSITATLKEDRPEGKSYILVESNDY